MDLSKTAANIRPRNPYEAIDLGATMVRHWWKDLWRIWFTVSLPFFLCIWFLLYDYRSWAVLLLWWCKPLWETPILHFIAEKLFNEKTSPHTIISKSPRLLLHDIFLKLTLRRFSITRSFDMPVSELERLQGSARNKRLNVLHRTSSSAAIWLTVVGTHLESIIVIAFISLIWMFMPEYIALEMEMLDLFISEEYNFLRYILAYIAMSCMGPFYVASGFCLYINRRTILEGWDIELRFKQLMNRVKASTIPAVALALMFGLTVSTPDQALANIIYTESDQHLEYTPTDSRDDIINILESDAFNVIEEDEIVVPKNREFEIEEEPDLEWLEGFFKFLKFVAQSLEVILWGLAIAAIIFLLFKLNQYRVTRGSRSKKTAIPKPPDSLFGLDIRQGSLPDNIVEAAKAFWQQNNFREAYSLLYRGALTYIAHEKQIPLHESFTEEECVQQFQAHDDGLQPLFFAQLTQQWQALAYGHQIPETSVFETTCEGWQFHFEEADHHHGGEDG